MPDSYKLFSDVILVEGAFYNALYDLGRQTIFRIPKENSSFLQEDLINIDKSELNDNFELLLNHELIHQFDEKEETNSFPKIDFDFDTPEILSNIIISFSCEKQTDNVKLIKLVISIINQTQCTAIQLRFNSKSRNKEILEILSLFKKSRIRHIGLVIEANENVTDLLSYIENNYPRVNKVIFYNLNSLLEFNNEVVNSKKIEILNHSFKDFPRFESLNDLRFMHFRPNVKSFSEAKNHSLYHNKKLYLESNGNIFASPFHYTKIGNIHEDNIKEIVENDELKRSWEITKDRIETCKDCEFRYVCYDGRNPIYDNDVDLYKMDSECRYNPFTGDFN